MFSMPARPAQTSINSMMPVCLSCLAVASPLWGCLLLVALIGSPSYSLIQCSCLLQTRPVRKRTVVHHKQLTQDELLAEAARTEIENLKDLEVMVAMEEATKKKATAKKAKYSGPMVRFHSRKVDGAGAVSTWQSV